jgi:phosphoribosyl 1,2-cyclic phosphodiesterase
MKFKFWGTRGSVPVPGASTLHYGGNTPCIEIRTSQNKLFIIDAGTGIRELGNKLCNENFHDDINILISHTHWDHIQGLLFFKPFYSKDFTINIHAYNSNGMNVDHIFDTLMSPPYFPATKEVIKTKTFFMELEGEQTYSFDNFKMETIKVHHSKGTLAFKFTENGKQLVYMTDNEILYDHHKDQYPFKEEIMEKNQDLISFCKDADYLIHDAMYQISDYDKKIGWGHSNNISLAIFAMAANVKNLILYHYEPDYTDEMIDKLIKETKNYLLKNKSKINLIASYEKMELNI